MINDDNLKKLYDGVIANNQLVTKSLTSYGFNSKNIKKLVDTGIIERNKRGFYTFIGINDLFDYGKKINKLGEYDKSMLCFDKCFELATNNQTLYLQLFISYIVNGEYEKSLKCLKLLIKFSSDNEFKNNIFYLYLLDNIIDLPDKDKKILGDNERLKQSILSNSYNEKCYLQNAVRILALNKRFTSALNKQKIIDDKYGYTTLSFITNKLLNEIISRRYLFNQQILQLIDNKKYEEIIELINNKKYNNGLKDYYTVYLSESIIEIKNTGIIPEPEVTETDDIYVAMDGQNYELAQKLDKQDKETACNITIIKRLLRDINQLIDSIKQEQEESNDETPICISDNEKFHLIFYYLSTNNKEKAFNFLHEYLEEIDNTKYESFIKGLIEISIFIGDKFFGSPIQALISINNNDYYFEKIDYTEYFFECLKDDKLEEARLYLEIIKSLSNDQNKIIKLERLLDCSIIYVEETKGAYTKKY